MGIVEELEKAAEEAKQFPTQKLEQWPAFLRHRRSRDPEGKGNCRLNEYEVEQLCNLVDAELKNRLPEGL